VKARNFKNNDSKLQYAYLLTPSGIENKARLTATYLQAKMAEYERLRLEIEQLKKEVVVAEPTKKSKKYLSLSFFRVLPWIPWQKNNLYQ